jgi:proton glutamate symport protein
MASIRRISLTQWIILSMIVGVLLGWLAPGLAVQLKPLSTIFLNMIKSLIAPLLFATLVVGIAGHGDDMKKVGRLAFRSIVYFELVTTLALAVSATVTEASQRHVTFGGVLEHIVPSSFIDAAAKNEVLQVVFWSIIFAVALARTPIGPKKVLLGVTESLGEVMFKFVGIVMSFAPFGIGAAIAVTVGQSGVGVLRNLGILVLTLYGALVVFVLAVLIPVALIFRIPIVAFWKAVRESWLIAFSTASSEAALPRAMQAMEAFGVPRRIVAFVMPTGYSFNLDGSTLYLALASVFVAQAAGIDMPLSQQILMMLTLMVTSKGVAAVPRASLVILSGALTQFGLPLSGVALILGVDAVMDMARTSINLVGNCLATAVMARWEGELGTPGTPVLDSVAGQPLTVPPVAPAGETRTHG